ncbi:MAG: flagellar basal body-associated FliL family protein [Gammaproteobacteria bacterium]
MAQQIPTLTAAPGQAGAPPAVKPKGKLPLLLAAVLVLAAAGVGAYFIFANDPSKAKKHQTTTAEAHAKSPALYVALDPPFVVNFEAEQLVRFLQVTVQVMSRDPATVELIKTNDPVVRNDLLLLLGNQSYVTISSREGKEKLRLQALDAVRKVVVSAGGKAEQVEAVYFTSFVMQ